MTVEEKLEYTRNLAKYGDRPAGPVTEAPSASQIEESIFGPGDLLKLPARFRWVILPGGKRLCMHAPSLEEVAWINIQALNYLKRKQITAPDQKDVWFHLAGKLFQVIACARPSEDSASTPVFSPSNDEALARNLGWEMLQHLAAKSDEAGGEDLDLKLVLDFFGLAVLFSQTWCSRLSTESLELCREDLGRFASCVSLAKQRGRLLRSDLELIETLLETPDEVG